MRVFEATKITCEKNWKENGGCRRKLVIAMAFSWQGMTYATNQQSSVPCSNEKGNCGCIHAEIKLILNIFRSRIRLRHTLSRCILVTEYSPCTNCANAIVESQLFHQCYYNVVTEHDIRGIKILRAAGLI